MQNNRRPQLALSEVDLYLAALADRRNREDMLREQRILLSISLVAILVIAVAGLGGCWDRGHRAERRNAEKSEVAK